VETVDRREFLQGSLLTAATMGVLAGERAAEAEDEVFTEAGPIIDTQVYLSRWPFRRIPGDEDTAALVELLRGQGVVQAWTGSFDGVFHKDVGAVNARLADACRTGGEGLLVPFGTVNPKLPDWEEELRRCAEQYRMPGIRLHPNYHGYGLDDPAFVRLLELAADRGMIVQLVAWMEDTRHQNPLMPVPDVDLAPLAEIVGRLPKLRIVLHNALHVPGARVLRPLVKCEHVYFDLAKLELIEGLAVALESMPIERLLFSSYSPMFYFESTLLKLRESALSKSQANSILQANAQQLLAASSWKGGEAR
jgi:predicted TIM-barrel fold metal-dependent hydrolase